MNLWNLLSKMRRHDRLNMASLEAGLIARRENSLFASIDDPEIAYKNRRFPGA
jgi:hypothetical protein